jgi:NAD(P)-dependent dehydrogenase (short-subunit alcohol dehydrogenase family)
VDLNLGGKVAVVTGASRGIGRAIVAGLLAEDAFVVAGARDVTSLSDLKGRLPCRVRDRRHKAFLGARMALCSRGCRAYRSRMCPPMCTPSCANAQQLQANPCRSICWAVWLQTPVAPRLMNCSIVLEGALAAQQASVTQPA